MAFNVKKNKRLPSPDEESTDSDETQTVPSFPPPSEQERGVVATRGWVYKVMSRLFGWTKFFATESMQVAGGIHAGRIETGELKTNEAYATSLTLIDPNGRPGVVYINELGELKIDYDFQDVFMYPAPEDILKIKNFVYRYGREDDRIAANFVGLTPIELLLNFIPFKSNGSRKFQGKTCYRFCAADGKEEIVDKTLLVTCPSTHKIVGMDVLDEDGNFVKQLYRVSSGKTYTKMTINMPAFKPTADGAGPTKYVILPGDYPSIGTDNLLPFVAPFLLPPRPHWFPPPTPPLIPPKPFPTPLDHDIFDESEPVPTDNLFDDIVSPDDEEAETTFNVERGYTVEWETYEKETYFNVALNKSDFNQNQEQYVKVVVEEV